MKKLSLALLLVSFASLSSFAREPKAAICGEHLEQISKNVLALNLTQEDLRQVDIRGWELEQFDYDANGNEITLWNISWGYKQGEMSFETYSFKLKLSSAGIERLGECQVRAVEHSDIVE